MFNIGVDVRDSAGGGGSSVTVRAGEVNGSHVVVGIFEGAMPSDGSATPIAEYAAYHEFGAPGAGLPARPWMRAGLSGAARELNAEVVRATQAVVVDGVDPRRAFVRLGIKAQAVLKRSIRTFGLIDTGAMRNAVMFEIRDANGQPLAPRGGGAR